MIPTEQVKDAIEVLLENARADIRVHDEPVRLQIAVHTVETWLNRQDNPLRGEVNMGSYEFDQENYLHYTGNGWVSTKRPLTPEERVRFENGELDYFDFEWK